MKETRIFTGFGKTRCVSGPGEVPGRTGWGSWAPLGVSPSLSQYVLSPASTVLLLAPQVCGLHVWGAVNNADRTGHDLSLHWPFCGLWVNIVVAIITGELRGDAIMTTGG